MTKVSESRDVPVPPQPVQNFTLVGGIEPKGDSYTDIITGETTKIKSGEKAKVPSDEAEKPKSAPNKTTISTDVVALKQKNILHENGPSGDQELSNAATAFKNTAGNVAGLVGAALSLKSLLPNKNPRDIQNNYFLTDQEKALLATRATQFASPGIVPYDALEEFLYTLCYINAYEDMRYISAVTGVSGLDNRSIIRQPLAILNLADLSKVGYLANGVCSITKRYSTKYPNAIYASDSTAGSFGALSTLNNLATSYGAISSSGVASAALSMFTGSGGSIKLPGIDMITDMVSDIAGQAASVLAITTLFGSSPIGTSLGLLSSVAGGLTSVLGSVQGAISAITSLGAKAYEAIAGGLSSLFFRLKDMINFTTQLSGITTAVSAIKMGDISSQLSKVNSLVSGLVSSVGSITSLVGALGGLGDIGKAATSLLSRAGGLSTSSILTELTLGQRVPPSMICNNPMMQPPSFVGRAFFGEGMTPRMATDQMFCRRIATYPNSPAGSGVMSFQMQNFGSFGGSLSLPQLVSRITLGVSEVPTTGALSSLVSGLVGDVSNILGVASSVACEVRRSDNAIPLMVGISAALVGETKTPFGVDNLANGWKAASAVGNEVQKYNPSFLSVCRGL